MRIVFGSTDTGLVRSSNQDRFACGVLSDNLAYGVLCDGMGGENGGGIASEIATNFAAETLERDLREDLNELSIKSILLSAMSGANALVYEASRKDPTLEGMGTTMILAVLLGNTLHVAYVGDSRVYKLSKDGEKRLTRDHTVVQMLVDIGQITEEDALSHPKRHYITRAVGVAPGVDADYLVETLAEDDVILLCSDGMYNYLAPGGLAGLLEGCLATKSAEPMISYAKAAGGADNITAVVMA